MEVSIPNLLTVGEWAFIRISLGISAGDGIIEIASIEASASKESIFPRMHINTPNQIKAAVGGSGYFFMNAQKDFNLNYLSGRLSRIYLPLDLDTSSSKSLLALLPELTCMFESKDFCKQEIIHSIIMTKTKFDVPDETVI